MTGGAAGEDLFVKQLESSLEWSQSQNIVRTRESRSHSAVNWAFLQEHQKWDDTNISCYSEVTEIITADRCIPPSRTTVGSDTPGSCRFLELPGSDTCLFSTEDISDYASSLFEPQDMTNCNGLWYSQFTELDIDFVPRPQTLGDALHPSPLFESASTRAFDIHSESFYTYDCPTEEYSFDSDDCPTAEYFPFRTDTLNDCTTEVSAITMVSESTCGSLNHQHTLVDSSRLGSSQVMSSATTGLESETSTAYPHFQGVLDCHYTESFALADKFTPRSQRFDDYNIMEGRRGLEIATTFDSIPPSVTEEFHDCTMEEYSGLDMTTTYGYGPQLRTWDDLVTVDSLSGDIKSSSPYQVHPGPGDRADFIPREQDRALPLCSQDDQFLMCWFEGSPPSSDFKLGHKLLENCEVRDIPHLKGQPNFLQRLEAYLSEDFSEFLEDPHHGGLLQSQKLKNIEAQLELDLCPNEQAMQGMNPLHEQTSTGSSFVQQTGNATLGYQQNCGVIDSRGNELCSEVLEDSTYLSSQCSTKMARHGDLSRGSEQEGESLGSLSSYMSSVTSSSSFLTDIDDTSSQRSVKLRRNLRKRTGPRLVHTAHSLRIMRDWWNTHEDKYPNEKDVYDITRSTGLTSQQVYDWFKNERSRKLKDEPRKRQPKRLPKTAIETFRQWAKEHLDHPNPTKAQRDQLALETGVRQEQVVNWFMNFRKRSKSQIKSAQEKNQGIEIPPSYIG